MARTLTPLPLQGASPTLQPTARPLNVNIGATPEPTRSPLGELSAAFRDFNEPLHDMLRTAAIQQENDTLAAGEVAAIKTGAANRLGELDSIIKSQVDAGTFPHVRAPAFERGFRSRVGSELAQSSFQETLMSGLPALSQVDGTVDATGIPQSHSARVEKFIADTRKQYLDQLHPTDSYAIVGFDQTSKGVVDAFRQRAAEAYTASYKEAGEQAMADDNSERAYNLATAPAEDFEFYRNNLMDGYGQLRNELPKGRVNEFYLSKVIAPAVSKLTEDGKFTEARTLIESMNSLDLTGQGGILGKTSIGKSVLAELSAHVEAKYKQHGDEWQIAKKANDGLTYAGEVAAGSDLLKMRQQNAGGLLQDQKQALKSAYLKDHPTDQFGYAGYSNAVDREFEDEQRSRADPRVVSDIESRMNSLGKDDIEKNLSAVEAGYNGGQITPSQRSQLVERLAKLKALYGVYDEGDIRSFKKNLYAAPSGVSGGGTIINFGDGGGEAKDPNGTLNLWDKLTPALQAQHETLVTQFFQQSVEDYARNKIVDPLRVPAEKNNALDSATTASRVYALTLLRSLSGVKAKEDTALEARRQATAIRQAPLHTATLDGFVPPLTYAAFEHVEMPPDAADYAPGDPLPKSSIQTHVFLKEYHLPTADGFAMTSDAIGKPSAERDIGVYRTALGGSEYVDLKKLAADATQTARTGAGNIDLYAQPKVSNADGSISTVDSSSYRIDGKEVLLPSVTPDGRHLVGKDAIVAEYRKTGNYLGKFDTPDEATAYATALHEDYAAGKYSGAAPESSPYLARTAAEVYGAIKSTLGFTPDEILAGKTKHGVTFRPSEIDPKKIRVFRDVAELNKHWNLGKPDETFRKLGDALDPSDRLTIRAFYLQQRALLKK